MTEKQIVQNLRKLPRISQSQAEKANTDQNTDFDKIINEKAKEITAALENISKSAGINVLLGNVQRLGNNLSQTAKDTLIFDKIYGNLTKTLGVTSKQATQLGVSLANSAKELNIGQVQATKYLTSFQKILPGYSKIITQNGTVAESFVDIQTALQVNAGLSEDAAASVTLFAGAVGGDAKNALSSIATIGKEIEKSTGIVGAQKQILQGIANAGASAQLQFGRIPGALELAVLKANQLGFSIKDLSNIGNNLLNIEQSVSDELEYQLLSGQKLVKNGRSLTNEYRQAFLTGDADKQAETLQEIISSQKDVLKNNVLARQQLAKTLNIDEEKLSKAIQMEELRNKLRDQGIEKSSKEFQDLFAMDRNEFLAEIELSPELQKNQELLVEQFDKNLTESQRIDLTLDKIYTDGILKILKKMGGAEITKAEQEKNSTEQKENKITSIIANTAANASDIGELTKSINTILTGKDGVFAQVLAPLNDGSIEVVGTFALLTKTLEPFIGKVANLLPIGGEAVNKLVGLGTANFTAAEVNIGTGVESVNDFIITDSGRVIKPNSSDTIVGFKPGGPIEQSMNSNASIDYNALASAVASAMKQVSVNVNMNTKAMANAIETEISMNQYQRMT
jgi:hypothetical protein